MQTTVAATADWLDFVQAKSSHLLITPNLYPWERETDSLGSKPSSPAANWGTFDNKQAISTIGLQPSFITRIRGGNGWRSSVNHKALHKYKEDYIAAGQVGGQLYQEVLGSP